MTRTLFVFYDGYLLSKTLKLNLHLARLPLLILPDFAGKQ
jgi:hypothetical protein